MYKLSNRNWSCI